MVDVTGDGCVAVSCEVLVDSKYVGLRRSRETVFRVP